MRRNRNRVQGQVAAILPPHDRQLKFESAASIVKMARDWMPYGGPPQDKTFVAFGLNSAQFRAKLWDILSQTVKDEATLRVWEGVYPRPRTGTAHSRLRLYDPSLR